MSVFRELVDSVGGRGLILSPERQPVGTRVDAQSTQQEGKDTLTHTHTTCTIPYSIPQFRVLPG